MRVGGAEGDPERDGRRALINGWKSRLENKHLREGSSVRQFGRPRPLRIGHRRIRRRRSKHWLFPGKKWTLLFNTLSEQVLC